MTSKFSTIPDTTIDLSIVDPSNVVTVARKRFDEGKTKSIKFRRKQLNGLVKFLEDNEEAIIAAVYKDFKKPKQETITTEILILLKDTKHTLNHLNEWTKPEKPTKALNNFFDGVSIYNDPYGVVLVMGAWNYPFQLALSPVVGAIAAGNCVVIKPSELAPNSSQLMFDFLPNYLDPECYPVFQGTVKETTELLKERFDYIFFTGSTRVGRMVQEAACKNLTPTTLELGGKSPAYIDSTADIDKTVKRILWGKGINSGQTCIAPDYILCTKQVQEKFVQYAEKVITQFYGNDMKLSLDYCRIVNETHFNRLINLMKDLDIVVGGRSDPKDRYIELSIATNVSPKHNIMQEEIFGPILPIVIVNNVDEAIDFINAREKPLVTYIFSTKNKDVQLILQKTSSGGVCINDTILHVAAEGLPFGGVGNSGMGAYHGKKTFDIFTHKKSVLERNFHAIPEKILSVRYPPYSNSKTNIFRLAFEERRRCPLTFFSYVLVFLFGVGLTIGVYFLCQALI